MLENLLDYEQDLFLHLNNVHTPFGNQFMWLFSSKMAWIPVAMLFIIILFYKNRRHLKEILLVCAAIVLVVTLCDQFSSSLCKPFFMRFRPTHHPDFMNEVNTVFNYRGGRYGFISSHATNAFGFAMLTSLIFKYQYYSVMLFGWATINAYSRIYLGVHFITDIVPGIILGLFFGWLIYRVYVYFYKKVIVCNAVDRRGYQNWRSACSRNKLDLIIFLLIITVVVIAVISSLYALNLIPPFLAK